MLEIKYKNYEFAVSFEEGEAINVRTIISIESDNETVESFNSEVFFDMFVGYEYLNEDDVEDKLVRRIKRAFAKFLREDDEAEVEEVEEANTPVVKKATREIPLAKPEGAIDRIIFDTVSRALNSSESKEEIDVMIKELIKENGIIPFRTQIEIKKGDTVKRDIGLQHYDFEKILRTITAKVPVALVGPAGSGKTTIVRNVSKALDIEFSSQAVSAQSTVFDFFGYKNATGDYVGTLFRDRYENGGVFLLDEFDAGNPNVLAALNQAFANEVAPFPDKMINKHEDFIPVMAGNTFGHGGTIEYVGRNKIDAATLDRFAFIYVDYDEDLEYKLATNQDWCNRVQGFRKLIKDKKVKTIVSPRATFLGCSLLEAGLSQNDVEEMLLYKGLNQDERNLLKQ